MQFESLSRQLIPFRLRHLASRGWGVLPNPLPNEVGPTAPGLDLEGSDVVMALAASAAPPSNVSAVLLGDCIARSMTLMSASIVPSAHAVYTRNIVVMLWPCCLATHSGLWPIMRSQLTDEWRAQYGFR